MTSRSKASKKKASGDKGATSTRPSRLRVTRPEVEEVLRSPRRGRPKQQQQQHKEEEEDNVVRARYDCAFQDEGDAREFAPSQMVWCKVRSHPWWPAQVFDAADASELALQHARAGAPLVAYFWDKTFAWSDASALLPFRTNFTRLAGQSTIFNFVSAVDAALQEVGRRVEAGLSCACFPATIAKKQEIENSGIRVGAYGAVVDDAYMRDAFCGKSFLDYLSALGKNPMAGTDLLDLATAKAQLRSFNRSRGTRDLPEYAIYQGIEDVAQVVPHAKRKITEKSSGDDVPSKEKKTRRGESSSRKREAPPESAKKEAMDEGSSVPSRGATDDALSKGRKSKHRKSSAKKKEDTSIDSDKRDAPAKKEVIVDDSSVTSRAATDDTLSKERKSKDRKRSVKKKKDTSEDADKREAVPKPTKEEATDEDSSMPSRGATDDTLSKKRQSKISKSMAKKKKDTSKDADGLEAVGGSKTPAAKAMDGILSESKSGRRLRSMDKMEEALEGLKGLGKDDGGETIKGEYKDASLLKEDNLGRRASSARKKDKITEGRDGLADGSARDSVSPGKKRPGRGENSVAKNAPISISEHGRKKKKLSELMAATDTPNPAPSAKSKAGGKRSLHASTEKLEDPDRDMKDTVMTRKRKKLNTLGDFCSQAQPLSRKKSTKVGEMMHKGAGQKSQTPPVVKANGAETPPAVKANGAASQMKSRRAKSRQVTVSDNSPRSMKVTRGKKGALTEDSLSCVEMLSQLRLAACDLKKIGKISPASASFFTDFKKSSYASSSDVEEEIPKKAGNTDCYASSSHADEVIPEKATNLEPSPSEPPLADHMKDDYWADILINVEEPLSSLRKKKDKGKSRTSKKEHHAEKVAKKPSLSLGNTEEPRVERKQDSENGEQSKSETEPSGTNGAQLNAEEMENPLLAGLVLHFSRPGAVPSRSDLIKIFSQYGPVNEAKTEIANNTNCAQVIFKRRMDAEAAFGGAGKISALGPALVSFRLTDFPSAASGNGPLQGASKSE